MRRPKLAEIIFIITSLLTISFKSISAENIIFTASVSTNIIQFQHCPASLWQYLRLGLNYLESPKPLDPPETVHPCYIHPDKRGFGAYGLSPEAYEDVQLDYPFFRDISWENILNSQELYELANQAYADWLLKRLKPYLKEGASSEEIFDLLHRAWNVGLTGFKNGRMPVSSRLRRAEEFKQRRYF